MEVFDQREDSARPITANDVIDSLGWSRRTAHNKLGELVEDGVLDTMLVGARSRVWWIPERSGSISPKSDHQVDREKNSEQEEDIEDNQNGDLPQGPDWIVERFRYDIPSHSSEERKERANAIFTAYELLREQEAASTEHIKEYTYERHPDGSDPQRQWVNYVRDVLRELPRIEAPPRGASMWQYISPDNELDQGLDVSIESSVTGVRVTGEGRLAERYRAMIQIAYNYLKENGQGRREDFERILPGYTGHYQSFEGMWSYFFRDALASLPGVERPPSGGRVWVYVEPGGELDEKLNVELDEWVENLETPGEGSSEERLRAIAQIAYNHLKQVGEAERDDFEQALPNYTGHYSGFDGMWQYFLKDALVEKAPGVRAKSSGDRGPTTYAHNV